MNLFFEICNVLVNVGESVPLKMRSSKPDPCSACFLENVLTESPRLLATREVDWSREGDGYWTRIEYTPETPGHYDARLTGPDGEVAARYFAGFKGNRAVGNFLLNGTEVSRAAAARYVLSKGSTCCVISREAISPIPFQ